MADIRRIGVLTGGGDAPGLNAVIRAVVKASVNAGIECLGIEDSFDGLIEVNRSRLLTARDVTGILRVGGTILGTTNRGNPFAYPVSTSEGSRDYSERCIHMARELGIDALVVIGGDGTLAIAHRFAEMGIPLVGVPKTIDNDIVGTTNCFGFDTAVAFATDAIDRLHTTAEAHHRIMVAEVMGRYAGWIALYAGVAGGADVILIPEIPFDLEIVEERIRERERWGARFSIVVAAEGARPKNGVVSLLPAGRRRGCRAAGRHRQEGGGRARGDDRQGVPRRRARPLAARRSADQLRPRARDPLRRQGRRAHSSGRVRAHGGVPSARHRRRFRSSRLSESSRPCRWTST